MTTVDPALVAPPEVLVEPTEPRKDSVQYETHRKLLDEKKKVQQELDSLRLEKQEREEADARKRGDYEAIVKSRDEELAKERERRIALESTFQRGQKLNAVISALGGNLEEKWYKLIDVSKVPMNPDTGEVDNMAVAQMVESLKREWPEMMKQPGTLPAAAPKGNEGGPGMITESAWKLIKTDKEKMQYKPADIVWGS